MKSSSSKATAAKSSEKSSTPTATTATTATAVRRNSASVVTASPVSAPAPATTTEDAPRLRSNRPVKPSSSGRSAATDPPSTTARTEAAATAAAAAAPPAPTAAPNPPSSRPAAPAKPPSRKSRTTPTPDSAGGNANATNTNNINIGSSCSSLTTEKTERTGQRSAPPSLPLHRATNSHDGATLGGSEEGEAGIMESTRTYLTRLSLEDAVVALERLRFLMMSHTAAVTGNQGDGTASAAEVLAPPPPQQMHVDPFKLSKRPLEVIAEELCSQLRRLTTAYAVASAADRCLLGVSDARRPTQPFLTSPTGQEKLAGASPLGGMCGDAVADDEDGMNTNASNNNNNNNGDLLGTFGPMVSTQHMMTTIRSNSEGGNFLDSRMSVETDDSWGVIDLHKPNPGPRIAYPQREDSETGQDFNSTVYKYPNGMVVSYPLSTFGELVSTESGQGTTNRSRGATLLGTERRVTVSDGTQTDDTLEPTKKEKDLQAYVKALEARLTEKQRLEAMRESRGAKKSGISETLSRLARSVEQPKPEAEKPTTTATHAHDKQSHH